MARSGQRGIAGGYRGMGSNGRPNQRPPFREVDHVFRRRQAKTHGRMMREELAESFTHLRMAAAHAAGGTAGVVGPRVDAAGRSVKPKLRKASGVTIATVAPLAL